MSQANSPHRVNHSAILPYSCEQMYELVNHVSAYPDFIPHCSEVKILPNHQFTIYLKKGPFSHSFTTQNTCIFPHQIKLNLIDGPFSFFEGQWTFEPLGPNACKVSIHLNFEIKNIILNKTFGKLFDNLANQMLDAFCQRAAEIYKNKIKLN